MSPWECYHLDIYGSEKEFIKTKSKTRDVEKVANPFLLSLPIAEGKKDEKRWNCHHDI